MKIIECNRCNNFFEIQKVDLARIEWAKDNDHSTILIICPKCQKQTTWHRLTEFFDNPDLLEKQIIKEKIKIDKNILPKSYYNHLLKSKINEVSVSKDRDFFKLYSLTELFTNISIDKQKYMTIFQLKGFLKTLLEVGYELKVKEILLMENALTIGYENGDILFIDKREKNSNLYIFYHDGGDIDKIKLRINDITDV